VVITVFSTIAHAGRRSWRSRRVGVHGGIVAVALGTLALAACGSSSSNSSATTASPGAASPVAGASVATNSTKLGDVVADTKGMTLYTLTKGGQPVACTGQCASVWPPLLLASGDTSAKGPASVTGLGMTSMNGGQQVTDHGDPLYRYSGDSAAGDTNGEGLPGSGGSVWHAAKVSGATNTGSPATTAPAASSGGGAYGY
jgi:predicted lipoprotein with Yx(FWY)xxD motif